MAGRSVGPLPFAFLLALATDANSGKALLPADTQDNLQPLHPGMLSGLLNLNENPEFSIKSVEQVKNDETTTVVQYFPNFPNFRNCFSGYWRNC
jgi:hypothetical protein